MMEGGGRGGYCREEKWGCWMGKEGGCDPVVEHSVSLDVSSNILMPFA